MYDFRLLAKFWGILTKSTYPILTRSQQFCVRPKLNEQAKFSPIDYAVSLDLFTDPEIARTISVRQYDRYLNWNMKTLPVPPDQAIKMVSNMHIITAIQSSIILSLKKTSVMATAMAVVL